MPAAGPGDDGGTAQHAAWPEDPGILADSRGWSEPAGVLSSAGEPESSMAFEYVYASRKLKPLLKRFSADSSRP